MPEGPRILAGKALAIVLGLSILVPHAALAGVVVPGTGTEVAALRSPAALDLGQALDRVLNEDPKPLSGRFLIGLSQSIEKNVQDPVEKRALRTRLDFIHIRLQDGACRTTPQYAARFSAPAAAAARTLECLLVEGKGSSDKAVALPLLGGQLSLWNTRIQSGAADQGERTALLARLEVIRAELIVLQRSAARTELKEDEKGEVKGFVVAGAGNGILSQLPGGDVSGRYPSAVPTNILASRPVPLPGKGAASLPGTGSRNAERKTWQDELKKSVNAATGAVFHPVRLPQANGATLEVVSPHVARATDNQGRTQLYAAKYQSILTAKTPREREAVSRQTASEIVSALGLDDAGGRRSNALQHWLYEAADRVRGGADVKLLFTQDGELSLVLERQGGGSRIESAKFDWSTTFDGKRQLGLIVTRPTQVGPDGKVSADPRRWKEYLADGDVQQWRTTVEIKKAGFFKSQKTLEDTFVDRVHCTGDLASGRCAAAGSEKKHSTVTKAPGSSTLGVIGQAIYDTPVVGHVLKGGEWVGGTLYNGVVSGVEEIAYAVSGNEALGLEAAGGYANNSGVKLLLDDDGYLSRLTAGQKKKVSAKALELREKGLSQAGFTKETTDSQTYAKMMATPLSKTEMMAGLRQFGAGTYGHRILTEAGESKGWAKAGLTAAGVLTTVAEGAGEYVLNPVVWATWGLGAGVTGLQGAAAAGTGVGVFSASAVPAALTVTQAAYYTTCAVLYTPWILEGVENAASLPDAWQTGTDAEKWTRTADALGDVLYVFAP